MDLSIIIPVYNTPTDALQRCFDSLSQSRQTAMEVLVIDDGSEEETAAFCQAYARENEMFRYFRKENGGVSSARNLGLEKAQGNYITFLDADDALFLPVLMPFLKGEERDLILFDIQLTQQGRSWTWYAFDTPGGEVSRQALLKQLIVDKSLNGPVAKLYRRQIVEENRLRFDTGFVTGEDWDFVSSFAGFVRSVWYEKQPAYQYFRDGDTGKNRTAKFPDTVLENTIAMLDKKLQMVQWEEFSQEEAVQLRSGAAVIAVENLFNTAADYLVLHQSTTRRKTKIRRAVNRAAAHLSGDAPRKTKIKAWIIRHFWIGVYPLAYLREIYLKRKG